MTARIHRGGGNRQDAGEGRNAVAFVGVVVLMTMGLQLTMLSGNAASLAVDGGVTQVFAFDVPPPPRTDPLAACGDLSAYDGVIEGTDTGEVLHGTSGRDVLVGHGGDDIVLGGLGDDCLVGGAGNDLLYGHKGRDVLLGGAGHDLLFGGWGEDSLDGGPGHNVCLGGLEVVNCVVGPAPGTDTQTAIETQRELDPARTLEPDSDEAPLTRPVPPQPEQPLQPVQPGDAGATGELSAAVPGETAGGFSEELGATSSTDTSLSGVDADLEASAD